MSGHKFFQGLSIRKKKLLILTVHFFRRGFVVSLKLKIGEKKTKKMIFVLWFEYLFYGHFNIYFQSST